MNKEIFLSIASHQLLSSNGLDNFNSLWGLDLDWHEPPNYCRGGWSGVCRHLLHSPTGSTIPVFIKRQFNHRCQSAAHPIRGTPTLYREYRNILVLQKMGIGTVDQLYYGEIWEADSSKAILVTHALDGYISLEHWPVGQQPCDGESSYEHVVDAVAKTVSRLHQHRIQHGCLYAKHIFLKGDTDPENLNNRSRYCVILIDLEKSRRRLTRTTAAIRDLDQLFRHTPPWFAQSYHTFLASYGDTSSKILWNKLLRQWTNSPFSRQPRGIDLKFS